MEEKFEVTVGYKILYDRAITLKTDWVQWCWDNIGYDNFTWVVDPELSTYTHNHVDYVYVICFDNEEDRLLFILNWL